MSGKRKKITFKTFNFLNCQVEFKTFSFPFLITYFRFLNSGQMHEKKKGSKGTTKEKPLIFVEFQLNRRFQFDFSFFFYEISLLLLTHFFFVTLKRQDENLNIKKILSSLSKLKRAFFGFNQVERNQSINQQQTEIRKIDLNSRLSIC